jgi:DNA-binding transcriptional ArsR family regulator
MFRALGDPSRLRLLGRLSEGEVCVSELAEFEDEKLSTVSARRPACKATLTNNGSLPTHGNRRPADAPA